MRGAKRLPWERHQSWKQNPAQCLPPSGPVGGWILDGGSYPAWMVFLMFSMVSGREVSTEVSRTV